MDKSRLRTIIYVLVFVCCGLTAQAQFVKIAPGSYIHVRLDSGGTGRVRIAVDTVNFYSMINAMFRDSLDKAFTDSTGRKLSLLNLPHAPGAGFTNEYVLKLRNGIWQVLPDSTGGRNVYLHDSQWGSTMIIKDSTATIMNYNLKYAVTNTLVENGYMSFSGNIANDSTQFTFTNGQSIYIIPPCKFDRYLIHTDYTGGTVRYTTASFDAHNSYGTDSCQISIHIANRGTTERWLTVWKHPLNATAFSPSKTAGTMILQMLLPAPGGATDPFAPMGTNCQVRIYLWIERQR